MLPRKSALLLFLALVLSPHPVRTEGEDNDDDSDVPKPPVAPADNLAKPLTTTPTPAPAEPAKLVKPENVVKPEQAAETKPEGEGKKGAPVAPPQQPQSPVAAEADTKNKTIEIEKTKPDQEKQAKPDRTGDSKKKVEENTATAVVTETPKETPTPAAKEVDGDDGQPPEAGDREVEGQDLSEEEESKGGDAVPDLDDTEKINEKENVEEEKTAEEKPKQGAKVEETNQLNQENLLDESEDSHFLVIMVILGCLVAVAYIGMHNKKKILGLIFEGRSTRGRGGVRYRRLSQRDEQENPITGETMMRETEKGPV